MLTAQFQSFYDQICENTQVPDDIREKIITYFLKIFYLHKNADHIYEQKGKVDRRYLKRIEDMIASLEKESLLKLFDFKNLDSAISNKIEMIKQVYQEGLREKIEEAKEKLRIQQEEEEERNRETNSLVIDISGPSISQTEEPLKGSTDQRALDSFKNRQSSRKILDPKEAMMLEMVQKADHEDKMISLAEQMKAIVRSYNEALRDDEKLLDTLIDKTDQNLDEIGRSNERLDDVMRREKKIGFFRLLVMAIIALVLFASTIGVILLDRTLFGWTSWFTGR